MSELIKLEELEADAIAAAESGIDHDAGVQKWPPHVHYYWTHCYWRAVSANEQAA